MTVSFDIVVPTVGRPSLHALLEALGECQGPRPGRVLVVDDRPDGGHGAPLADADSSTRGDTIEVLRSGGRGPAAARNVGWRRSTAEWVVFLDDDVLPPSDWLDALAEDLGGSAPGVAASQGRIEVPLPSHRRPTDWERNVAGLEQARWATADMAARRGVLAAVGGFDERFPRAYREDADLGLRITAAGWRIVVGERTIMHPVRPAPEDVSVRMQAGNAEDPFMRALHGRGWRQRAGVPAGRRPWHLATVSFAGLAVLARLRGRSRISSAAAGVWLGLTADFARRRICPGPRALAELRRMTWTSVVLPFAATWHWLRGVLRVPGRLRSPGPRPCLPAAVLFDRDGTLVHDVPYNGDPERVAAVDGARPALDRLRRLGIPTGVITNQSGVGRGLIDMAQVHAVNRRIEEILGHMEVWAVCPHAPAQGCRCRKPAPGLIHDVAEQLDVDVDRIVVIGDIGSDVDAAIAAGAQPIMVPTQVTRRSEVEAAPMIADDLVGAVELALSEHDGHVCAGRRA